MSETTAEERLQHALELSFRYLGPRARTEAEMSRHLAGKGLDEQTVEAALTSLRDQGYLDDARFAREFTQDKRLLEEWGAERIERRLLSLGVAPARVRDVVGERGRGGESEAAQALLERRFPVLEDDPRELRRAIGVLVRKGYDSELAWDLVRAHARGGGCD
jgi:regulatory protein